MKKKSVLWLVSWYPDVQDPFNGDFIQRHAIALSKYLPLTVIYVTRKKAGDSGKDLRPAHPELSELLEEQIIYYSPCVTGVLRIDKLMDAIAYYRTYKKALAVFLQINGKPGIVHVHVPIRAGILALWLKRKLGLPFVLTEHYGIYNTAVADNYTRKNLFFKYFTRRIVGQSSQFAPVSASLGKSVNEMVIHKPFTVVYNTVDTSLFRRNGNHHPGHPFRFIHVSNMVALKNVPGIISAFSDVHNKNNHVELILVGKFDPSLKDLATACGEAGKRIMFTGEVSYAEVANQMKMADAFVLFSKSENMPCVVLEALCCGLPVIATDVGGIAEIINESNGILIPSGDQVALYNALLYLIMNYNKYDPENIEPVAHAQFGYDRIGANLRDLYQPFLPG